MLHFPSMNSIPYPVRINRYLMLKGHATRREADELVARGLVTINGTPATLGAKVCESDTVTVRQEPHMHKAPHHYFAYHKPKGVVSSAPQNNQKDIRTTTGIGKNFFPVGRLDKASSGLILLTNDGRIVDRLLNPKYEHEKEYAVSINKKVTPRFLRALERGVTIEGYKTKPARVARAGERTFRITLTEGKKHQIRRMTASLGYDVIALKRTRIMHIKLGALKEGAFRPLRDKERDTLLRELGL